MAVSAWLGRQAYLLLVFTALIWAGNAIAGKMAAGHVSPFLLTGLRWAVALTILAFFAGPYLRRDWAVIRRHWPFLAALGAIGFALFNNLFYLALNYTTAINVAIVQASMPLMVFALNFVFFGIRAVWLQVAGFVLTIAGVALVATRGDLSALDGQVVNFGDAIMVIAIFCYGIYSVALAKKPDLHWVSLITVLAFFAFIASLPFTAWEIISDNVIWPDTRGWMVIFYTAIGPAIVAQVCWVRGLELIGSNRGGVFINIVPIFAAVMAVFILGERFETYHAIAMALVLTGVALAQRVKPAKTGPQPSPDDQRG